MQQRELIDALTDVALSFVLNRPEDYARERAGCVARSIVAVLAESDETSWSPLEVARECIRHRERSFALRLRDTEACARELAATWARLTGTRFVCADCFGAPGTTCACREPAPTTPTLRAIITDEGPTSKSAHAPR